MSVRVMTRAKTKIQLRTKVRTVIPTSTGPLSSPAIMVNDRYHVRRNAVVRAGSGYK